MRSYVTLFGSACGGRGLVGTGQAGVRRDHLDPFRADERHALGRSGGTCDAAPHEAARTTMAIAVGRIPAAIRTEITNTAS